MGLLGKMKTTTPFDTSKLTFSGQCASALRKALQEKKKLSGQCNMRTWTEQFDKLLEKHESRDIKEVLDWYCSRLGGEWVPEAFSAKSFRLKYAQLVEAMQRDPDSRPVSHWAQHLAEIKRRHGWPAAAHNVLPAATQRSRDNYQPFFVRVLALVERWRTERDALVSQHSSRRQVDCCGQPATEVVWDDPQAQRRWNVLEWSYIRMADSCLLGPLRLCYAEMFVEWWLDAMHASLKDWHGWRGGLNSLIWTPRHRLFQWHGQEWLFVWDRDGRVWDKFVTTVLGDGGDKLL